MPEKLAVSIKTGINPPDVVQLDEVLFSAFLAGDVPVIDTGNEFRSSSGTGATEGSPSAFSSSCGAGPAAVVCSGADRSALQLSAKSRGLHQPRRRNRGRNNTPRLYALGAVHSCANVGEVPFVQ